MEIPRNFISKKAFLVYAGVLGVLTACGGGSNESKNPIIKGTELVPRNIPVLDRVRPYTWGIQSVGEKCVLQPGDEVRITGEYPDSNYGDWLGVQDVERVDCYGVVPEIVVER